MTTISTALTLLLGTAMLMFGREPASFSKCDLNQDGATNVSDVQGIVNQASGANPSLNDLNGDGVVSVADIQIVVNASMQLGCAADGTGTTPAITDFNPKSAPAGTLVTIVGANLQPAAGSVQVALAQQGGGAIAAPVSSAAANALTFVIPAGAATGIISLTANGSTVSSGTPLTIVPSSTFSLSASPGSANLIQGQSISYSVKLTSSSGTFAQLAALSVTGLPTGAAAVFTPPEIALGQESIMAVSAPAGQSPGASVLTVSASSTVDGMSVTSSANVTLNITPISTSFLGRTVVDDGTNTSLAGVAVSMVGQNGGGIATGCTGSTTSDASGNFALTNLPASCLGPQLIGFNGDGVTSPAGAYAGLQLVFTLVANQVVVSPVLVHLPRVDTAETFMVMQNANVDQSYTFKTIPGLSITVYAGTTFTKQNGTQPNPFPLAAIDVPVDRLPDVMPTTTAGVAAFIVAFQPAETNASKAVAVWFPNILNTPPGTDMPLMTLDPTLGRMVPYGTGTASNDGATIIPDIDPSTGSLNHRFGIVHFDWHGPVGGPPNTNNPSPDPNGPTGGEPVDLASGVHVITSTDIGFHGDLGSIALVRTYRTLAVNGAIPGPFGWGSSHNYQYRLDTLSPQSASLINLILPSGTQIPFTLQANGTLINPTIPMFAGWVMTAAGNGITTLAMKGGGYYQFGPGIFTTGSLLVAVADKNGNVTKIVRPSEAPYEISEIDDPAGRKLTFEYTGPLTSAGSALVARITDPIGRTVSYTYDSAGYLATYTDVLGGVTSYLYDTKGRVTQITDPHGAVTKDSYDTNGRVSSQILPSGGTMTFAYTLVNALLPTSPVTQTVVTDSLGHVTTCRFNTEGFVLSVTDPTGQVRRFTRQIGTNQLVLLSGTGICPACGNTQAGDLAFTYDPAGNMLTRTDALGNLWSFTYDPAFNNLTSRTDPLGNVTTVTYDNHGNATKITDARGNSTLLTVAANGLVSSAQDAAGNITRFTNDSVGNLVSVLDPLSQQTKASFDGVSRQVAQMDPMGRTTSGTYNAGDEATAASNGNGNAVQFSYDLAGLMSLITDANGGKITIGYDGARRVTSRSDALGRATSYRYDTNGNLIGFTNRRGQEASFGYDQLNRVVSETYADATVQRTYDSAGRLARVVDSQGGVFSASYDLAGRLTRLVGPNGTIAFTRDALGRVISRQVLGQPSVSYAYDPNGNLTQATMGAISATRTYDSLNRLISETRSNGVTRSNSYDPLGRILTITEKSGGVILFSRTFTYDAAGQIAGSTLDAGLALSTPSAAGTVDAANQLAVFGGSTYTSDADGNRLNETSPAGTTSYSWDARGRLQALASPGGAVTYFVYDPGNMVITERVVSPGEINTQAFMIDDAANIVSVQQGAAPAISVLDGRAPDDIIATLQGNSQAFPLADQVGSEAATTDSGGNVVAREFYEPFGAAATSGNASLWQFTARPLVNGTLYYDRARFYDSATARFLNEDPLDVRGGDLNLYAYVGGNPVSFTDPFGLLRGPVLRGPDYIGADVSYSIPALPFINLSLSLTYDRYGNVYLGPGFGLGYSTTPVSGSLTGNWIWQCNQPGPEQLTDFLTTSGFSGAGGFWGGVQSSYTPGSGWALGAGIVTPQVGLSYHYSFKLGNLGPSW